MGSSTGKAPSLPNFGPTGGAPIGPNHNPNFNPSGTPGGQGWWNPVGNTGRDMYGRPIAGQPQGPGNQLGGGGAASQASTQGFNQWLQGFMQSGGMQQMMGQMQQGPQFNPYMSLINPQGGSYKPPQVGNPGGYPGGPNSGTFGPGTGQPLPPVNPNWKPGDEPWGAPAWRPGMPGGPISDPGIPNPNGGQFPVPSYGPFAGGNLPKTDLMVPGGIGSTSPPVMPPGQPEGAGWETGLGFNPTEMPEGGLPYGGGNLKPPTGGPTFDPMLTPWAGQNPLPEGASMGGGQFNAYGMPTGGIDMSGLGGTGGYNLGQVGGNYQGGAYNQFSGQKPGDVNGSYNQTAYNPFSGTAPGMLGAQNGAWNDPGFLQQLQMGLGGSAQLADAGSADVYGKFATDTQNLMGRAADRNVADLRARYGMGGGSNLGSAAALAEGNFLAENNAQVGRALGEINVQERGLNLQSRGQDLQNYLGSRGLDVSQLGMMAQNNQFGGDLNLRAGMADQNSQMGWQQLMSQNNQFGNNFNQSENQFGANLGMQGQLANQQNSQNWNQLGSQNNQWMNQFNQNDSQFGANFGQNAQMANNQFGLQNQQQMNQYGLGVNSNQLQNQQQMNGYGLGVAGIGQQQQQMQQQQQQFMFQQMMQAYMAQAGWNTPQAENVVKPSAWGQAAQGVGTALDWWTKYKEATRKY